MCCGNCPAWYGVVDYHWENETRSDCINGLLYNVNDPVATKRNRRIYYSAFFAAGYAVPLTIICILYVLLIHRIGGRGRVGGHVSEVGGATSRKSMTSRRRVMRMVTAVIVTFALCWLPTHVSFLVDAFVDVDQHYNYERIAFQIAATCLAYLNSCLNPVIYAFLSENFRQSFRELLLVGASGRGRARGCRGSRAPRPRHRGDGKRTARRGRSDDVVDGQLGIPMMPVKQSVRKHEFSALSALRTVSFETATASHAPL